MDNYDALKIFLDANDVRYDEDSFDDGDRFLVIPQKIKSGALMNVMVIFSDIRIKILILGFKCIFAETKFASKVIFLQVFSTATLIRKNLWISLWRHSLLSTSLIATL